MYIVHQRVYTWTWVDGNTILFDLNARVNNIMKMLNVTEHAQEETSLKTVRHNNNCYYYKLFRRCLCTQYTRRNTRVLLIDTTAN